MLCTGIKITKDSFADLSLAAAFDKYFLDVRPEVQEILHSYKGELDFEGCKAACLAVGVAGDTNDTDSIAGSDIDAHVDDTAGGSSSPPAGDTGGCGRITP